MKVAILGAGVSGLACAHRLLDLGVTPRIYEEDPEVGNFHPVTEALLDILYRPLEDPLRYLSQHYNLYLHPQQTITRLRVDSPRQTAVLRGFWGFVVMRGRHPDSLERQLASQLKAHIQYGPTDLRTIARESDYVVVATGDPEVVSQVQPWFNDATADLAVATIHGKFDAQQARVWLGRHFAPGGYGFLIPESDSKAGLAIAVPRDQGDIADLWQRFLTKLDFAFEIKDLITIRDFQIGHIEKNQIGNFLFIGNAGGALMPFMGFGIWDSILSGLWAAEAIVWKQDFNRRLRRLRTAYRQSLALRRTFAGLSDQGLDRLVRGLASPVSQALIVRSRVNLLKLAGLAASIKIRDT